MTTTSNAHDPFGAADPSPSLLLSHPLPVDEPEDGSRVPSDLLVLASTIWFDSGSQPFSKLVAINQ